MDVKKTLLIKTFQWITNNHSLSLLQQQTQSIDIQEEDIRMSVNLPLVEGTSENYCVYSDLTK